MLRFICGLTCMPEISYKKAARLLHKLLAPVYSCVYNKYNSVKMLYLC